ncbi:2-succinyl-6-hydroxy-2,4-cyclohexadiene-1-carboxylate synthase [Eupransor demetentiae]|uniref:Putative 2-succinyl-6-hydroxy-2,4-cyclohexadiene-1-carboxylate synthase n=1 Tax=Eupransor demetentiae TaxID=3109584 RepID=A0ABP0EPL2_9LACO|nr:Lysophospholipase [Lactobacillaceae bacterium LMG 33000]
MIEKRILTVNGYQYELTGYQENPGQQVWFCLHGFMGSGSDFKALARYLPGTVWTLDLPGYGYHAPQVSRQRLTMATQIADLKAIFKEMNWQQLNLLGYSMGGRLALGLSLALSDGVVQKLILESSTAGIQEVKGRERRQILDRQRALKIRQDYESFVKNWENLSLFASQKRLSSSQRSRIRQHRLNQNRENMARSLEMMGTGFQDNFWPRLNEITIPVILLTGELDSKFRAIGESMVKQLPNAHQVVVPNRGHNIYLEDPKSFCEVLKRYVSD